MNHPFYNFCYLASLLVQGISMNELTDFIHEAAMAERAAGTVFDDTSHTGDIQVESYDAVKKVAVVSCRDYVRVISYDRNNPDLY